MDKIIRQTDIAQTKVFVRPTWVLSNRSTCLLSLVSELVVLYGNSVRAIA